MLRLAWRNLAHERTRLIISVGGVALAVLLIQVMNGLFAGGEQQATAYIRNQPARLWVMQAGVENIHMASSILPADVVDRVRAIPGVETAVGVLYAGGGVEVGDTFVPSYLFGVDPDAPFGGPWSLAEGTADPAANEIVVDRAFAQRYGLGLGDTVNVMGHDLMIAGLSKGTFGIAVNLTFVNEAALAQGLGIPPQASSYILVKPVPGTSIQDLAERLRAALPEANVMTQTNFIASERELIRQMGVDVIRAMNTVAYVVGLLVIGLTIYTATLERSREYGVLKAIGAKNPQLVSVVFAQAFVAAGLGYQVGVGLAYGASVVVSRLSPDILILLDPFRLLREVPVLASITALAALLPVGRLARLDPLVAFRA